MFLKYHFNMSSGKILMLNFILFHKTLQYETGYISHFKNISVLTVSFKYSMATLGYLLPHWIALLLWPALIPREF